MDGQQASGDAHVNLGNDDRRRIEIMRSIQPELRQGIAYVVQLFEFLRLDESVSVSAMNAEKALIQVVQTKFDPQK